MHFTDRAEAGRLLARECARYRADAPVVLALPRGGVPVAREISDALQAPLDLLMVRKIGAPGHSEYGIGAVVDGAAPQVILDDRVVNALGISQDYIDRTVERELAEIERRRVAYAGARPPLALKGRTVIIADDGIATGGTLRAALAAVRKAGVGRVVVAVPVAPPEVCADIEPLVDQLVVLQRPRDLVAVGAHYEDFQQLEDAAVLDLMKGAVQ